MIFTASWHVAIASQRDVQPVRVSRGVPRWYPPAESFPALPDLFPDGWMLGIKDMERFGRAYRRKLHTIGLERIQAQLDALIEAHGRIALACFEADRNACHRGPEGFAGWYERQTGIEVPELPGLDGKSYPAKVKRQMAVVPESEATTSEGKTYKWLAAEWKKALTRQEAATKALWRLEDELAPLVYEWCKTLDRPLFRVGLGGSFRLARGWRAVSAWLGQEVDADTLRRWLKWQYQEEREREVRDHIAGLTDAEFQERMDNYCTLTSEGERSKAWEQQVREEFKANQPAPEGAERGGHLE